MHVATGKRLTMDGAKKMMAAAIDKGKQAGIAVTVAIADAGGHLILLERMEGGPLPHRAFLDRQRRSARPRPSA